MSYIIPIPVWGFKQSNTGFICAVGRCVKFIVPINISQMCVYKQIVRFVYNYLFHFKYTLKILFSIIKYLNYINILFSFHITSHNQLRIKIKQTSIQAVHGLWTTGVEATKHRLHPSIYFN